MTIRVGEAQASERFYRTTLGALGIEPSRAGVDRVEWDDFIVTPGDEARPPTRNLHVAFVAPSRDRVDDFWRAGTAAGYYGAFLRDPDGNSAEAVHHLDLRRGGHVDHLWVGVRDLEVASAFYTAVMRFTGLREGRRWEGGRQFRGAWATFSLVADGRPATENLQLAFPAPDRETVDEFHSAATAAGYRDDGPPGERPAPHPAYAASVLDPEGAAVESIFRKSGPTNN